MARKTALKPHEILEILNDLSEGESEGENDPRCFSDDSDYNPDDSSDTSSEAGLTDDDGGSSLASEQREYCCA